MTLNGTSPLRRSSRTHICFAKTIRLPWSFLALGSWLTCPQQVNKKLMVNNRLSIILNSLNRAWSTNIAKRTRSRSSEVAESLSSSKSRIQYGSFCEKHEEKGSKEQVDQQIRVSGGSAARYINVYSLNSNLNQLYVVN
jgi:hypothetical protein